LAGRKVEVLTADRGSVSGPAEEQRDADPHLKKTNYNSATSLHCSLL
jgi:hypothetical protein